MYPFEHGIKVVKILESNIEKEKDIMNLYVHELDIGLDFKHM